VEASIAGARCLEAGQESLQGAQVGFVIQAPKEQQSAFDGLALLRSECVGVGAAGNDVWMEVLVSRGQSLCIFAATDHMVLSA
jgi:hypothetical protein